MMRAELAKIDSDVLWKNWVSERSQPLKDELVIRYIPLVRQVAGRLKTGLPDSVELEELVNAGIIGLIGAVDNFNLERGFKFETYAIPRIRGSILDSLRDYDWMPRSIRTKAKNLEAALVKLVSELGRMPDDEEVAGELGVDLNGYYQVLDEVRITSILSLDEQYVNAEGETISLAELVEDEDADSIADTVEWKEAKEIAKSLIGELKQQERLVIALYYYEELTLREIGDVLGISESRVSQIHSKIMLTLKGKLRSIFSQNRTSST